DGLPGIGSRAACPSPSQAFRNWSCARSSAYPSGAWSARRGEPGAPHGERLPVAPAAPRGRNARDNGARRLEGSSSKAPSRHDIRSHRNGDPKAAAQPSNEGPVGPSGCLDVRYAQDLAWIDLVGMRQHGAVGLEDHRVLGALALAVMRLGDLPEIVALFHRVEDWRLGRGGSLDQLGHVDLAVQLDAGFRGNDLEFIRLHLRDSKGVAHCD